MKYKSCVRKIINKYQRPIKPLKKKREYTLKIKKGISTEEEIITSFKRETRIYSKLISTLKKYFITSYTVTSLLQIKNFVCFVLFYFISFAYKI